MVVTYKGFRLFAIPRAGGHFVRVRPQDQPRKHRETSFVETAVFATEACAIEEAKRLIDFGS